MDNIGQCQICRYMRIPGESQPMEEPAWCYMFREPPVGDCKKLRPYSPQADGSGKFGWTCGSSKHLDMVTGNFGDACRVCGTPRCSQSDAEVPHG